MRPRIGVAQLQKRLARRVAEAMSDPTAVPWFRGLPADRFRIQKVGQHEDSPNWDATVRLSGRERALKGLVKRTIARAQTEFNVIWDGEE